ncbi:hypothetical protein G3T14_17840 [Methylobacterium sp. BTF04]|uniref:DUF6968 family protein n=1 Tax=Methylobacterium sp. BTF04 TaxID=2708300 RepID=UPI0013D035F2|nr:hypothetical protein [Methylobacterium sp. BTF04]NEU13976.1 hypothetical protein [Methylobacterium sp. BTF04]
MPASFDASESGTETPLPFVERRFILSPHDEIRAGFSRPEAVSPHLWRCSYRTVWADRELGFNAYGADSVHALLHAMERVHRTLLAEAAYREDMSPTAAGTSAVTWMGQRDLGLPMPGTVDTIALRAVLIADAQTGKGDLDHVILEECSSRYRKVARIAGSTLEAIGARCNSARIFGESGSDAQDPQLDTVLSRLDSLVAAGLLDRQGDLSEPRYSEVRRTTS